MGFSWQDGGAFLQEMLDVEEGQLTRQVIIGVQSMLHQGAMVHTGQQFFLREAIVDGARSELPPSMVILAIATCMNTCKPS